MRFFARAPAALLVVTLILAGCGQKGPLFVPETQHNERLQPLPVPKGFQVTPRRGED